MAPSSYYFSVSHVRRMIIQESIKVCDLACVANTLVMKKEKIKQVGWTTNWFDEVRCCG